MIWLGTGNFGQKITFYDGNTNYSGELKDENGVILAQYSRTYPQGTENSYVSIKLPTDKTIIYYRNLYISNKKLKLKIIWYVLLKL